MKSLGLRQVILEVERFGAFLERLRGVEDDRIVSLIVELIEAYFSLIELGIDEKQVVDLPPSIARQVDISTSALAELCGILQS